jgi:hypothetical protein
MLRRLGRVAAPLLSGFVLVGGPIATQALDDGCAGGMVRHERDCVTQDTITVISPDGTDRADLEAAIEPFDGGIFLGSAGVYTVVVPGARFRDLAPIMRSLEELGFTVDYDRDYSRNSFSLLTISKGSPAARDPKRSGVVPESPRGLGPVRPRRLDRSA